MDWDEMSNINRGPSIDGSYQVSVLLAKGFQRRRLKCEKLTDDGCQVMAKTKNQQKIENYIKEFGFIFDFFPTLPEKKPNIICNTTKTTMAKSNCLLFNTK